MLTGYLAAQGEGLHEYSRRSGLYYFDLPDISPLPSGGEELGVREERIRYSAVVFDRGRAVADDGVTYLYLNHPGVRQLQQELSGLGAPVTAPLRLRSETLPSGVSFPGGPSLWTIYRVQMTNHDDLDRQELVSSLADASGQGDLRLARALLDLTPDSLETAFSPVDGLGIPALHAQTRRLAEARAADRFSEAQLAHAERLRAERETMERYYRQQEGAVAQIAIENIRLAKYHEMLERRQADLAALDRRLTLVPDLEGTEGAIVEADNRG
jgi:hypothetical protein